MSGSPLLPVHQRLRIEREDHISTRRRPSVRLVTEPVGIDRKSRRSRATAGLRASRLMAVWRIEVENFPAFTVIDDKGDDFLKVLNFG
jgi:hypothetical protein